MPPAPPVPLFVLRHHSAQINALSLVLPAPPPPPDPQLAEGSSSSRRSRSRPPVLCSGDADGWIAVTDLDSRRALAVWRAHDDGVLGIEHLAGGRIITSGRDNKLHIWALPSRLPTLGRHSAAVSAPPTLLASMDVNSLNYCRFSILPKSAKRDESWIAMPNLTDSETVDIFHLPSQLRPHAAIGFDPLLSASSTLGRGANEVDKTGIVMSIHLISRTRLLVGYESGHVILYVYEGPAEGVTDARLPDLGSSDQKLGRARWVQRWKIKGHHEAVMGLAVAPDNTFALSCSAEHLVVKYLLLDDIGDQPRSQTFKTKQVGNASISIQASGRVCAVGGWDGAVRLYSTKSLKPLGRLDYHRDTCHVVAFPNYQPERGSLSSAEAEADDLPLEEIAADDDSDSEDEEGTGAARPAMNRWLSSGGLDGRVAVWELMDFTRQGGG